MGHVSQYQGLNVQVLLLLIASMISGVSKMTVRVFTANLYPFSTFNSTEILAGSASDRLNMIGELYLELGVTVLMMNQAQGTINKYLQEMVKDGQSQYLRCQ